MLLSVPTWIKHLLTVSEWLAAILLLRRYAARIEHPALAGFAYAMLPHLFGGFAILGFHLSGDRVTWLMDLARVLTFIGSLSLLTVSLLLMPSDRLPRRALALAVVLLATLWALVRLLTSAEGFAALLPGANLLYLGFLLLLLVLYRLDRALFSPLTIFGFWFLLVFVAVTIIATWVATERLGLPSLAHADLLHGVSESLLSLSNLLIALGVYLRLRRIERSAPSAAG